MKKYIKPIIRYLIPIIFTDITFVFISWILSPDNLKYVAAFIILFTIIILIFGISAEYARYLKISEAAKNFIEMQSDETKIRLIKALGNNSSELIENIHSQLTYKTEMLKEKNAELEEYREYIEEWVHEAKTPLSLSSLVINNHRQDMSPYVYSRMNYIQHKLSEGVEQILFYARLQADHADYKFINFRLDMCVKEAVEEYSAFIEEKNISLTLDLPPTNIISDKKVVFFMLSQLISNAVKYADEKNGKISLSIITQDGFVHLIIRNNGKGILPQDAPFIFDKGFTGGSFGRQKATGMGLYLVQKYAEKLCAKVRLEDTVFPENKFGIEIIFSL